MPEISPDSQKYPERVYKVSRRNRDLHQRSKTTQFTSGMNLFVGSIIAMEDTWLARDY